MANRRLYKMNDAVQQVDDPILFGMMENEMPTALVTPVRRKRDEDDQDVDQLFEQRC